MQGGGREEVNAVRFLTLRMHTAKSHAITKVLPRRRQLACHHARTTGDAYLSQTRAVTSPAATAAPAAVLSRTMMERSR